jgi:hypothetical protein
MNTILEETIRLACLIRNSAEAEVWRKAWEELPNVWTPEPMVSSPEDMSFDDYVVRVRLSDQAQARPLFFPFILAQLYQRNDVDFRLQIERYPKIRKAMDELSGSFVLTRYIITFLRSVGTGFPHEELVYTIPDQVWMKVTSDRELPWSVGQSLNMKQNARLLGLERFIPSASNQVADSLNRLAAVIRQDPSWNNLDRAYKIIVQNKNLLNELRSSKDQFRKLMVVAREKSRPAPISSEKIQSIADEVYRKKGSKIKTYGDSFIEFESLIERIYWVLSHIIMYKSLTYLNSSDTETLQQVNISPGKEQYLTAVAPTFASGLAVGRIMHISMPEASGIFDGLYQITNTHEKYQAGNRLRLLLGAQLLWSCQLSSLQSITKQFSTQVFIPSEKGDFMIGTHVDIGAGQTSLGIRELIAFDLSRTMYMR